MLLSSSTRALPNRTAAPKPATLPVLKACHQHVKRLVCGALSSSSSNSNNNINSNALRRLIKVRAASILPASPTTLTADYIRHELKAGDVEQHGGSVVVLGDVPVGVTIMAVGDVIVMGKLAGKAVAGIGGKRDAIVVSLEQTMTAEVVIADVVAPILAGISKMLVLEPGASSISVKAMPGTAVLAAAAAVEGPPAIELGALLGVVGLAVGFGLMAAPSALLDPLTSLGGGDMANVLLEVFVYGYIMLQGANLLGDGSEMLLEILNPGIIGGVVLPLLGAVPDATIVLNAGLRAPPEDAQAQVAVGVGTLAGSTILLLSLVWGGSVLKGQCDLDANGEAIDRKLTKPDDWENTGVTVDENVRQGAAIMAASVLLYGFVQIPVILGQPSDPQTALVGGVVSILACAGYCIYQVISPELQSRKIQAAQMKRLRQYVVKSMASKALRGPAGNGLMGADGRLDMVAVDHLFDEFDEDKSGEIDSKELKGLMRGLVATESMGAAADKEAEAYLLKSFDTNKDGMVSKEEFHQVLEKWVGERVKDSRGKGTSGAEMLLAGDDVSMMEAPAADVEEIEEDEDEKSLLTPQQIAIQACTKLGAGVAICATFSDPLVEGLTELSSITGIAPFFAGFVLAPLASNASEALSSLNFASKKRKKNTSLTFAQVYGAVTMNNTLVLGLFMLVVWIQKLEWVYSSEVTVIAGASLLIGALGYSGTTFKTKLAIPTIALYPASLAVVYLLDTYLGWQ